MKEQSLVELITEACRKMETDYFEIMAVVSQGVITQPKSNTPSWQIDHMPARPKRVFEQFFAALEKAAGETSFIADNPNFGLTLWYTLVEMKREAMGEMREVAAEQKFWREIEAAEQAADAEGTVTTTATDYLGL